MIGYDQARAPGLLPGAPLKKAIVVLLSLFFMGCGESLAPHFKLNGETMGTRYHITVLEEEGVELDAEALQQAVDQQLQQINQQMSTYIADSELMRLNRAPLQQELAVSADLFDVLVLSMELSWLSQGAFDITVAPLVNLWGFGPGAIDLNRSVPAQSAIEQRLAETGYNYLQLNLGQQSVLKQRALQLDLSGIAKGFAVDKVAELIRFAGFKHFMVEIGGELRLAGQSPRGEAWRIAIEEPESLTRSVHRTLALSDQAMATSGDYRNYFEHEGERYSHTINPRTGYPITHKLASVTVLSDSAAYADALATALNVMGPEAGMKLAEQQQLAAYMIVKTEQGFESRHSSAFTEVLEASSAVPN